MNVANVGHRGDCCWTAIMLSKLPGPHTFWMNNDYVEEFRDLLSGMDISAEPLTQRPTGIPEGWIASGTFVQWQYAPQNVGTDILGFVRHYHNLLAAAGRDAIPDAESMLLDFPSLERDVPALPFDILAVNANPQSGQAPQYSGSEFDGLLLKLVAKGHRVLATNPTTACPWNNFRFSQIGWLSRQAKVILAVSTGPSIPTFNVWNKSVPRYIFLSEFLLDYGPSVKIRHSHNAAEMTEQLQQDGLL